MKNIIKKILKKNKLDEVENLMSKLPYNSKLKKRDVLDLWVFYYAWHKREQTEGEDLISFLKRILEEKFDERY